MRHADKHEGFWRARYVVPPELVNHLPGEYKGKQVFSKSTGISVVGGDADEAQRIIDDYGNTVALPAIEAARMATDSTRFTRWLIERDPITTHAGRSIIARASAILGVTYGGVEFAEPQADEERHAAVHG
jgi:hypothetical protein